MKAVAALLDKQYLYMVLGMVNICAVKALEFNPSSSHSPFVLRAYQHNNESRGKERYEALPSSALCSPSSFLAAASFQLAFYLSGQRRRAAAARCS